MNEEMLKSLIATRKVLKDKFKAIKMGSHIAEEKLEKTFLPISKPIKELLLEKKTKRIKEEQEESNASVKKKIKASADSFNISEKTNDSQSFTLPPKKRPWSGRQLWGESSSSSSTPIKKNETTTPIKEDNDESYDSYLSSNTLTPVNISQKLTNFDLLQNEGKLDTTYGLHKDDQGNWQFGNSDLILENDNIQIGSQVLPMSNGLYQLLFHKNPTEYDHSDLKIYKDILMETNAHKRNFEPNGQIKGNKSYKYKNIIKKLFHEAVSHKVGSSLMSFNSNPPNYIYWDDPNELVNRLRLLMASQSAGHNNHNNEIISIIEELQESNIIA